MSRSRLVALLAAGIVIVGGGSLAAVASNVTQAAGPGTANDMPVGGIFGSTSVWDQPVASAPVAAGSAGMVGDLVAHIADRFGGVAAFNAHQFTNAFYTAPASTPTVDVAFDDCQHKDYTPTGLLDQLDGIPIPAGAVPAAGTDSELEIWSPSTDRLWELWEAHLTATGWSACWGGRIDHVSTSPGYFSGGFGAAASGLAISGGTAELSELRAGVIDHALTLAIPDTAAYPSYVYPAQRTDGGDHDPTAIPEGTRLRLDPSIDVDTIPGLTPIARVIAHAAQTYGFIVVDTSGAVSVYAESGAADQATTGVDPWAALEQGVPDYDIFQNFPWQSLQVLPATWNAATTTAPATPSSASATTAPTPGLTVTSTVTATVTAPAPTASAPTVTVTDAHTCELPCTIEPGTG